MAKFTASVPLKFRLPGGFEVDGAVGATHRIPDALVEEFTRDQVPGIPGGVTWITQDETSGIPSLPITQANVSNLVSDLAAKYDKTGGTISGAVTVTGTLVVQAGVTAKTLNGVILGDQYSTLQAAHDALPAAGGTILVPAGTYTASTTAQLLLTARSNLRVVGAGMGATVFKYPANSVNRYLIEANGVYSNLTFEGFEIDGNGANQSAISMEALRLVGNLRNVVVRDVYIRDLKGSASDESLALNFGNSFGATIQSVYVSNCGGSGIGIHGSSAVMISNCLAVGCGWMGFTVSTSATTVSHDVTMTGCIARSNTLYGFNFESANTLSLGNLIAEKNGQYGIAFAFGGAPTTPCSRVVGSGILAISNGTLTAAAGIIFGGNATAGANAIHLSGVIAYDDQSAKTQTYGAQDAANTSNVTVSGDLRGNLTGEADLTTGTNNYYRPSRPVRARARNSANIAVNHNSTTIMTFNTDDSDPDGYHNTSSNTDQQLVPVGLAGPHRVGAVINMASQSAGIIIVELTKDGVVIAQVTDPTTGVARSIGLESGPIDCAAGSVFRVQVYQNSGVAVNAQAQTSYSPVFWIERL